MRKISRFMCAAVVIVALTSGTIADGKSHKLATCDGQHRRPANLYGSILPTVNPATGITKPASANGVDIFPNDPAPKSGVPKGKPASRDQSNQIVPPISLVTPAQHYRSC
jgi:hypothetical protein